MVRTESSLKLENPPAIQALAPDTRFRCLDWDHPVFFACVDLLPELAGLSEWPDLAFFNQLGIKRNLLHPDGRPLTFVHQPKKPSRWRRRTERKLRYEESVLEQAVIPMRQNSWHDFFNNLSWLMFPSAKIALVERLAYSSANRTAEDNARGFFRPREGDRLAMLDEGGVFQLGNGSATLHVIFGHALQESFVMNRLDVFGLTVQIPGDLKHSRTSQVEHLDLTLSDLIRSGRFAPDAPAFSSSGLRDIAGFNSADQF